MTQGKTSSLSPEPLLTGRSPHLFLTLGAGVTPAQGGAEPRVGSAYNQVPPLPLPQSSSRNLPAPGAGAGVQTFKQEPLFNVSTLCRRLDRERIPSELLGVPHEIDCSVKTPHNPEPNR